jgi:hypothetical protein
MSDLHYTDEEIKRLLRRIRAEQKRTPAPDEVPGEAEPEHETARPAGLTRELSIDEILKKVEAEISGKKPASVNGS